MAHERKRHVRDLLLQRLKFSPIVGVFGHRQVGKSTLIAKIANEYRTLDDVATLEFAHEQPKKFIQSMKQHPAAIDECQMEPRLFPTLKERVRISKRPGQFILSGSVRFTSRKAIRESLAGRMASIECLPFSVSELVQEELNLVLPGLIHEKRFSEASYLKLRTASDS